jgi:hypothetical protein
MAKKKRKHIRFSPDDNTIAYFYVKGRSKAEKIHAVGLVLTEAKGGFSCAMTPSTAPEVGDICLAKVGALSVLKSECMWVEKLDKDVVKVGFQYLE